MSGIDRLTTASVLVSTILLAVMELFFLPERLDGHPLPDLGGAMLPVSIVVAAVTTPLLVRAAVRTSGSTAFGILVLLVWFLVLFVVGLFGPGGDMVFVADWRSLALVAAGLIPGAIAMGSAMGSAGVRKGAGDGKKAD